MDLRKCKTLLVIDFVCYFLKEPRQQVGVAYTFMYIEEDGMLFAFDWIEYYLIDCN